MARLRDTEYRVLSVVLRQTWGWRKERDWLSHARLRQLTGRGSAAISRAIAVLVEAGLIVVRNRTGEVLATAAERRRERSGLYFSLQPSLAVPFLEKSRSQPQETNSLSINNKKQEDKKQLRVVVDAQNEHLGQPKAGIQAQKQHEDDRNETPTGLDVTSGVDGVVKATEEALPNSPPAEERSELGMGQSKRAKRRLFGDPKIESNWNKLGDLLHQGRFADLKNLPWDETR